MTIKRRNYNPKTLNRVAEVFKTIAYPIRLEVLDLLEDGNARPVAEILEHVKIEASLLSHHLSKMKASGVLESYREGRHIYYHLA